MPEAPLGGINRSSPDPTADPAPVMGYKEYLTSVARRTRLKTVLRIGGTVIVLIGLMFFPARNLVFNKGDTSAFHRIADLGAFVPWGATCVIVGLLAIVASCLIRADLSD
jgi:hypothetical protein